MRSYIKRGKCGARFIVRVVFRNEDSQASKAEPSEVEINVLMQVLDLVPVPKPATWVIWIKLVPLPGSLIPLV